MCRGAARRTAGAQGPPRMSLLHGEEHGGQEGLWRAGLRTPGASLMDYAGIRAAFFRSEGLLQSVKGHKKDRYSFCAPLKA